MITHISINLKFIFDLTQKFALSFIMLYLKNEDFTRCSDILLYSDHLSINKRYLLALFYNKNTDKDAKFMFRQFSAIIRKGYYHKYIYDNVYTYNVAESCKECELALVSGENGKNLCKYPTLILFMDKKSDYDGVKLTIRTSIQIIIGWLEEKITSEYLSMRLARLLEKDEQYIAKVFNPLRMRSWKSIQDLEEMRIDHGWTLEEMNEYIK